MIIFETYKKENAFLHRVRSVILLLLIFTGIISVRDKRTYVDTCQKLKFSVMDYTQNVIKPVSDLVH